MNLAPTDGGTETSPEPAGTAIYFDGNSNRRRHVSLAFRDRLELMEPGETPVYWAYTDIRRVDGPAGMLRVNCLTAPALARLEIRDSAMAAGLVTRCVQLDERSPDRHGVGTIVGWSLAAVLSIVLVILFALPFAADRLAPLVPQAFERRIGDVAEGQIRTLFGGKLCRSAAGQAAWFKLVDLIADAAALKMPIRAGVLSTPVPNAFALPGGKVYLLSGLLAKAENPDEIAGVLAHELGHLKHRDSTRNLIYNGGTSFLIGLLFGDVTGSSALIFASRSLVTSSYSRQAEQNADDFAIEVMHRLGRPTKPMGELLFRVTGREVDRTLSIIASHPLTEDRLQRMTAADRPPTGPPLLTAQEWAALKTICNIKG